MSDGTTPVGALMSAAEAGPGPADSRPGAPLTALLRQLAELLHRLTDAQYAQRPVGVFDSSVGGHVRHCLDHVATFLAALRAPRVNYDERSRGTAVETDRRAALAEIETLARGTARLRREDLDRAIEVRGMLAADGPTCAMPSSVARELLFVVSHTVHHNAIIGAIAATLGVAAPERFGYAPSTIAFLQGGACAPSPSQR